MIKLVVFDLDNVIIDGEAIDEIGKLAGVQEEIAEITERAMQGDLDFETSIKERVKLLKGVSTADVEKIGSEMKLMDGAEEAITELKNKGYSVGVISGSFDSIAEPLKDKLGLDFIFANTLTEEEGNLTGDVEGPLVTGTKYDVLCKYVEAEGIELNQCIAVGDGANDISMMEGARIGIAFNAKPAVKEVADVVIESKNLKDLLAVVEELVSEEGDANSSEVIEEVAEVEDNDEAESKTEIKTEKTEKATEKVKDDAEEVKAESKTESDEKAKKDFNGKKDTKSKPKGKKRKYEPLESDFEVAEDPDEVRTQKDSKEEVIAKITEEREGFNKVAKEQRKIRDELNDSLKENLKLAIEFRDKRNDINTEVEECKKLRDGVNEELKKLEWSSGRRDIIKLENEIKKIDKIIETRVLDIKKENQLVKNANDFRKQLMEIQEDEKVKEEAIKLRKVSEEHHAKVVELSEQAQEFHGEMLSYFRKTDEIRTAADEAHKLFVDARKEASAKHEDFKVVLGDIHKINKRLDTFKSKRRSNEGKQSRKQNKEEKEKAESIFEKFKEGKKLSTEELLLLQKHDIF